MPHLLHKQTDNHQYRSKALLYADGITMIWTGLEYLEWGFFFQQLVDHSQSSIFMQNVNSMHGTQSPLCSKCYCGRHFSVLFDTLPHTYMRIQYLTFHFKYSRFNIYVRTYILTPVQFIDCSVNLFSDFFYSRTLKVWWHLFYFLLCIIPHYMGCHSYKFCFV